MFKKMIFIFTLFVFVTHTSAFAMDDDIDEYDAAEKARKAHEIASSDVIYQQEEWKALYYQNMQIIRILKEIRDTLDVIKARGGMKMEEKTA